MKPLRLWIAVCVYASVLLTSTDVAGQQRVATTPLRATVTASAPVYIEPKPLKTPLKTLDVDTAVDVLEESGDWSQVRFPDAQFGPRIGFVETRLLKIVRPEGPLADVSTERASLQAPTPPTSAPVYWGKSQPPTAPPRPAPTGNRGRTATTERVDYPRYKNHFVARSGVVFDAGPLMGIEISQTMRPALQGYGSVDWHQDAAREFVGGLASVGSTLSSSFEMTIPTFVGTGGIKVIAPAGPVRSYLLGGFGVGRLNLKATADGQEFTDVLIATAGASAAAFRATKPLFEAGGGVVVPAGRAYIDAGFRFRKFLGVGQPFEVSGLYLGAGTSF
jgi:hypothetical protein